MGFSPLGKGSATRVLILHATGEAYIFTLRAIWSAFFRCPTQLTFRVSFALNDKEGLAHSTHDRPQTRQPLT